MNEATKQEVSDPDVPESERGKGENMPLEERTPSAVFGIAALSYLVILIGALAVIGLAWWIWA